MERKKKGSVEHPPVLWCYAPRPHNAACYDQGWRSWSHLSAAYRCPGTGQQWSLPIATSAHPIKETVKRKEPRDQFI